MVNYKRKTVLLTLLNLVVILGFILFPEEINGNPIILLIAVIFNGYDLLENKKDLPRPYLFARYLFILLLISGIVFSWING